MTNDPHVSDVWADWLLSRRFGGDPEQLQATLAYLRPIRDRVLSRVALDDGGRLLDVGCGDGLIAFGALERFPASRLAFADISQDLLDLATSLAQQAGVSDRCEFLRASADDLAAVRDSSVDAVTLRSVLIYVDAKRRAFDEFYRVLKAGGRLSLFEPINRFGTPQPPHMFWEFDARPIVEIASKVRALYERLQPLDSDPMMDFDERDLIAYAEAAGFRDVHLELEVRIVPLSKLPNRLNWETCLRAAGNPRIPTLEEAMAQTLTAEETARFTEYLRPLVESGSGVHRSALAYLWATK